MENNKDRITDALGNEFEVTKKDFDFVQQDSTIHDVKFDTKPTTFAKDALKRFAKNKSSVVGAIIIGLILLLSIIVPLTSPHDTSFEYVSPEETLLLPKINKAGTGFWDGTKLMEDIPYSEETGLPLDASYKENAIINGKAGITVYTKDDIKVCSFRYDYYEDKLGLTKMRVPDVKYMKYVEQGLMTAGDTIDDFTIIDKEKCPIVTIYEVDKEEGNIVCDVIMYKYKGYKKMPTYIFGTDESGRDAFTLCFRGLGVSLLFAIFIAAICFTFGLIWGSISGYFGGNVDLLMERFCELLGGIPTIVIVTLLRLHKGASFGIFILALCLTGWLNTAARTRTQFYRFKGREYVLASRTLGSNDYRLIFKHILPNSLGTIVTSSVLMIPSLIFTEATFSYLQLGIEGITTFGTILSNNQQYISTYPALIVFPAVIISLLMISFNLFGNGLRDALNPSLKGSE